MEKEALISELKEKAQIDNLSERTIDEVATMFLPQFADDEKITDESWSLPVQMMKTMSGQLRHDLSGGINAFKTQFEADNKDAQAKAIADAIAAEKAKWEKENQKPKPEANKDGKHDDDIDKKIADAVTTAMTGLTGEEGIIGKLSKQFSDYLANQAEKEKIATEEQMRSEILKLIMSYDGLDPDDIIVENTMMKLHIEKGKDMEALKNEAKSTYEKVYKKFVEKYGGGQPFAGGGEGKDKVSPLIKSHIDRVAANAKDAQEYAESIEFAK